MNIYYVYAYLREKDLTPYYIGKGKGNRAFSKNHSVIVPKDKNRIIFYHTNLFEEDAFNLEIKYIDLFGRKDLETGILRNRTNGGDGNAGPKGPMSQNHKDKIALAHKGKPKPPQTEKRKREISAQFTGRKFSAESKLKRSLMQTGERNHQFGKKISATQSAQISESNRKRTPPNKGSVWWNNGLISKLSKIQPDENFVRGRLSTES